MNPLGGIGNQMAQDLSELGISAVKSVNQAAKDVAKSTIESLATMKSTTGDNQNQGSKAQEQGKSTNDPKAMAKRQAEKNRMQEVKSELEQYIKRKRQLDARIAQDKMREEQTKKQEKAQEKAQKESWLQSFMKRVGGQSHGETSKNKD